MEGKPGADKVLMMFGDHVRACKIMWLQTQPSSFLMASILGMRNRSSVPSRE